MMIANDVDDDDDDNDCQWWLQEISIVHCWQPGWVGGGGEEEEGPGGDHDQHGGDVVQEDVPLPPIKDEASA